MKARTRRQSSSGVRMLGIAFLRARGVDGETMVNVTRMNRR